MHLEHISFRAMNATDTDDILEIINYYIVNTTFYFSEKYLERGVISELVNRKSALPGYVVLNGNELIGFGYAYPFRPESTFSQTVKLTYWLKKGYTGKGIGSRLYEVLEGELRGLAISTILVNISSENTTSLNFHKALGYRECGNFERIGSKEGRYFDLVWLQKFLE